jgi:hypothetical protein
VRRRGFGNIPTSQLAERQDFGERIDAMGARLRHSRRAAFAGAVLAAAALPAMASPAGAFPVAAARAPQWSAQSIPAPTSSFQAQLFAVSCPSSGACMAAGYYFDNTDSTQLLAERWNGSHWTIEATRAPGGGSPTTSLLTGVSCASDTACVAVGHYTPVGSNFGGAVAESWDGTRWKLDSVPVPSGGEGLDLTAVSCPSHTSCTAVGSYYKPAAGVTDTFAAVWNGTTWKDQATPNPGAVTSPQFQAVSCVSSTACTAVGIDVDGSGHQQSFAEHWNGAVWSRESTPQPSSTFNKLNSVSCSSATHCTAVGIYTDTFGIEQTFGAVWDGLTWGQATTPDPTKYGSFLNSVACRAAEVCTAVGYYYNSHGRINALVEVSNGAGWVVVTAANPSRTETDLQGVSCTSTTVCTAVGYDVASQERTLAERSSGGSWAAQDTPNPTGPSGSALYGVSCASSTMCTAVGSTTNHGGPPVTSALAAGWSGKRWTIEKAASPTGAVTSVLNGVSCASDKACTAVGYSVDRKGHRGPLAETWNGSAWKLAALPSPLGSTSITLSAVSCRSTATCMAIGTWDSTSAIGSPFAELLNGTGWKLETVPSPSKSPAAATSGVSCSSTTDCASVWSFGAARWNGTTWKDEPTPLPSGAGVIALAGVSCPSTTACMAVGSAAEATQVTLAERWAGSSWKVSNTPNPGGSEPSLTSVSCPTAGSCTAVGNLVSGQWLTFSELWNGTKWVVQYSANPSNVFDQFHGVSCSSSICIAVGIQFDGSTSTPNESRLLVEVHA